FRALHGELTRMGAVPEQAMQPFVEPLNAFHARTAPADWLEGLVKAYVGDGFAADFYRAGAEVLGPDARALVLGVLAATGHAAFVTAGAGAAREAAPAVAGGLALWAGRGVGGALAQAHLVAAEGPPLARLVVGAAGASGGQGDIGRMFADLIDAHDR